MSRRVEVAVKQDFANAYLARGLTLFRVRWVLGAGCSVLGAGGLKKLGVFVPLNGHRTLRRDALGIK